MRDVVQLAVESSLVGRRKNAAEKQPHDGYCRKHAWKSNSPAGAEHPLGSRRQVCTDMVMLQLRGASGFVGKRPPEKYQSGKDPRRPRRENQGQSRCFGETLMHDNCQDNAKNCCSDCNEIAGPDCPEYSKHQFPIRSRGFPGLQREVCASLRKHSASSQRDKDNSDSNDHDNRQ